MGKYNPSRKRTKVRFLFVVALLTIPSIVFGSLFIIQSQTAISFAKHEIAGIQYMRSILPLYLHIGDTNVDGIEDALLEFEAEREVQDSRFETSLLSNAVVNSFQQVPMNSDSARFALLSLIGGVSDASGLTIDPDLDSFYLMRTMVFQTPHLMSTIDALAKELSAEQALPKELSQRGTSLFLKTMRLEDAAAELKQDYKSALSTNLDGSLERELSTSVEGALRQIHRMSIAGHRVYVSRQDKAALLPTEFQPSNGLQEKRAVLKAWTVMNDSLQRLVQQRLDTLIKNRNLAGGLSCIIGALVFFMGLGFFRSLLLALDDEIIFLAHHDAMTRLKNRAAFSDELTLAIKSSREGAPPFAIHAIDLDGFKYINDTFGHHSGDQVIQEVAKRLLAFIGSDDVVGRRGGDEFVILQRSADPTQTIVSYAQDVLEALRLPMMIDGAALSVNASIGSCIFGRHGHTETELMQSSDVALYSAKGLGKNCVCIFDRAMQAERKEKRKLETRVREAVGRAEFKLNYQPKYGSNGQEITGFEALLRLDDTSGKPISPVDFIPVLESIGLIGSVGQWVLNQACKMANQWPLNIDISVNVSPLQFTDGQLSSHIIEALHVSGLSPSRLEIEITESAVLEDTQTVWDQLDSIKALGVSLAMDDFGTGYSSLSSLWRFPFDKIKIDKSFLSNTSGRKKQPIDTVKSIVALAHSLSMSVTIEGVETSEHAQKMVECGCDELQGFYFSRPIPESELPQFLLRSVHLEIPQVKVRNSESS